MLPETRSLTVGAPIGAPTVREGLYPESPMALEDAQEDGHVALGEVRRPDRAEPYRTAGAVHPLCRALV